jgi:hypothetical protein
MTAIDDLTREHLTVSTVDAGRAEAGTLLPTAPPNGRRPNTYPAWRLM